MIHRVVACAQVLNLEEEGRNNLTLRLKKRALQGAYDTAVKRKKVPPTVSCAGAGCLAAARGIASICAVRAVVPPELHKI